MSSPRAALVWSSSSALLLIAALAGFPEACQPSQRLAAAPSAPPSARVNVPPVAAPLAVAPALAAPVTPQAALTDARCFECADGRRNLHEGWQLQAASKVKAGGADLSQPGYVATGWYPTRVPSTVLAALIENGVYPDPYRGNAFDAIPSAPFAGAYWYRTEFEIPAELQGQASWLNLDGINYRANVWLNGERIATEKELVGTFTSHEWNITGRLHVGARNALAIEVFPPDLKKDLALSWLDWNPTPADRNMGVWRDVYLKSSGPVAVRGTRVSSKVNLETLAAADLTIKLELLNTTDHPVRTTVDGQVAVAGAGAAPGIRVSREVALAAHETKTVVFERSRDPQLALANPKLWWPAELGAPNLYDLKLAASVDGRVSDSQPVRFGIREVSFEPIANGARLFRINGKRVMIRGGGWASDMLLRSDNARLETELGLVKDLGLNAIRLEGKLETDDFYAKADAYGILTIPGWMCCDAWQASKSWSRASRAIAIASMASQARRLRNHPSVIDFLIGSDEAPVPEVERELVSELRKLDWPNPITPSASDRTTPLLGRSGMKMTGPYDWVSPEYWYEDKKYGGAFGFNSETSPGPAVPELDSLRAWLAPDELESLWSKPKARLLHAGTKGTRFETLGVFNEALSKRYGKPSSLEDYVRKAQLMGYESQRVPFEAYSRGAYSTTTGIVQWLVNSAWPSLFWHLYGYDSSSAGSYFGAKKANEPLHLQYSYDDDSIVALNRTQQAAEGLLASVRVYDNASKVRFAHEFPLTLAADSAHKLMALPAVDDLSPAYFVELRLLRGATLLSSNWYWLSRKAEISDYRRTDWDYTPVSQFGDFTTLAGLPPATVEVRLVPGANGAARVLRAELKNTSSVIAFFLHLKLAPKVGERELLPTLWQDNYVSLAPGEQRSIDVTYPEGASRAPPSLEISGWNVPAQWLSVPTPASTGAR